MEYLNNFLSELDFHSNAILGCPLDIADTVLDDDQMYHTLRLYVFNRVLADALKSIGLKLRFTHLDRNARQRIFTEETCEAVYDHIISAQVCGMLNDRIAIDLLSNNMLGKLDCKVYFKGIEIFNN